MYTFTPTSNQFNPYVTNCNGPITIDVSETQIFTETCTFQLLSIIHPDTPNAKVFENYALSEAVSFKEYLSLICDHTYLVDSAIELCKYVIMIHC
jgi:hypothetical protein